MKTAVDIDSKFRNVLYYGGGWPNNIGNAFIDLGANYLLRQIFPLGTIGFASEAPRWFFEKWCKGRGQHGTRSPSAHLSKRFFPWFNGYKGQPKLHSSLADPANALDIGAVACADIIVIAGMAMCQEFVEINGPSIRAQVQSGTPLLLLGTGGLTYDDRERIVFSDFMREMKPVVFVSRDRVAYEAYADLAQYSKDGVDCGFFVANKFLPFPLKLPPYIVFCFDMSDEPHMDAGDKVVIRAHHDCWDQVPDWQLVKPQTLISDLPTDYLSLYANADEVHSDRVHACVAALSYGRRARFYGNTPRANLFHSVGASNIGRELTSIPRGILSKKQEEIVDFVRKALSRTAVAS